MEKKRVLIVTNSVKEKMSIYADICRILYDHDIETKCCLTIDRSIDTPNLHIDIVEKDRISRIRGIKYDYAHGFNSERFDYHVFSEIRKVLITNNCTVINSYSSYSVFIDWILDNAGDNTYHYTIGIAPLTWNHICNIPKIKDVVFSDPATIVFWKDGTKTVVKCQDGEEFDPEKGLTMAISKKALGNTRDYYPKIKKWIDKYEKDDRIHTPEEVMKANLIAAAKYINMEK